MLVHTPFRALIAENLRPENEAEFIEQFDRSVAERYRTNLWPGSTVRE